jgi:hypothetical protein
MGAIQASRGTRDILPSEMGYWQQVERVATQVLEQALYQEIRTPIFEQTALFERGIGEATDVSLENPTIVTELNALITGFLKESDAVIPKLNPGYKPVAKAQP